MNNLEIITNKIHIIRNQKVMLDYDLLHFMKWKQKD